MNYLPGSWKGIHPIWVCLEIGGPQQDGVPAAFPETPPIKKGAPSLKERQTHMAHESYGEDTNHPVFCAQVIEAR